MINEKDTSPASESYFHTPSQNARNAFFYPIALGRFDCGREYETERSSYDSFLILLISGGTCIVSDGRTTRELHAGNLMLIDCYRYHRYSASTPLSFYWLHFDGNNARSCYEILRAKGSLCLHTANYLEYERIFQRLNDMFGSGSVNESMISKYITDLLTLMLNQPQSGTGAGTRFPADHIISHINSHLNEPLSLSSLAEYCSLSPYYFTRIFKKETGYTPHEFILISRINKAKYELSTTDTSIKAISFDCGFQTVSHFCTAFKKLTGCTPVEYRRGQNY